jgi:dephospho-CoA kinase
MQVCGLTGGVGMGKSTAAGFFSRHGVCVVDTDDLARQLVQPGQPALAEIAGQFGSNLIGSSGELKRDELARLVFADAVARQKLEAILHPRIRESWSRQIEVWRREHHPVAAVVIPLLFETHAETCFDKIICVACSARTQMQRLRERRWPDDQIRQRIAAQLPVEQKINRSHFVIWTEGVPDVHEEQVARILKIFQRL